MSETFDGFVVVSFLSVPYTHIVVAVCLLPYALESLDQTDILCPYFLCYAVHTADLTGIGSCS